MLGFKAVQIKWKCHLIFGYSKANPVVFHIKFGVVFSNENIAKDP